VTIKERLAQTAIDRLKKEFLLGYPGLKETKKMYQQIKGCTYEEAKEAVLTWRRNEKEERRYEK
jgi:hypothetical protein